MLTDLEELSLTGELPCDLDGCAVDYDDDYTGAPDQAAQDFALPKGFGRLRKLRVLRLDCHMGMWELPSQVCLGASKISCSSDIFYNDQLL